MKQIEGFENYLISLDGKVFSLKTMSFLKLKKSIKHGYFRAELYNKNLNKTKKSKIFSVHRLVANAYLPNPENKPTINHIDGNKENNCLLNLEWNTSSENRNHAIRTGLVKITDKRRKMGQDLLMTRRKIVLNSENGIFYQSCTEAAQIHGICHQYMSDMLNGKVKNNTNFKYV